MSACAGGAESHEQRSLKKEKSPFCDAHHTLQAMAPLLWHQWGAPLARQGSSQGGDHAHGFGDNNYPRYIGSLVYRRPRRVVVRALPPGRDQLRLPLL
jgi:hypothetical protein